MGGADPSAQPSSGHDRTGALYPWRIPLRGWLHIGRHIWHEIFRDHVFIASSGVAFLALFALLPTLTALVSVYGLVSSPQELSHQLQSLSSVAPHRVVDALRGAAHGIVRDSGLRLGFGIALSICIAVWVALRAVLGIIGALNIVYGEEEKRSWPVLLGTAVAMALGALAFWVLAIGLIVGAPWAIRHMALNSAWLHVLVLAARWVIIAIAALVSMTVLYRFGPSHSEARWEWLSAGSIFGTALWLAGSAGMSLYISHAGHLTTLYGPVRMVMVVMTWFFLTALVFLIGAEFNIALKHQARASADD